MPICKICGKTLKNPNSTSHINSKFHQEKLKKIKGKKVGVSIKDTAKMDTVNELKNLKNLVLNLEKRIVKIESKLNIESSGTKQFRREKISKKFKDDIDVEREIINILNQRADLQRIKGNFALKDLRKILTKDLRISNKEFEDKILRLYRKQVIDLQPGGNPDEYHLISPTGKRFYYLRIKN